MSSRILRFSKSVRTLFPKEVTYTGPGARAWTCLGGGHHPPAHTCGLTPPPPGCPSAREQVSLLSFARQLGSLPGLRSSASGQFGSCPLLLGPAGWHTAGVLPVPVRTSPCGHARPWAGLGPDRSGRPCNPAFCRTKGRSCLPELRPRAGTAFHVAGSRAEWTSPRRVERMS